jgi:sodium pump decarboxylase gamma subunit
MELLIQASIIMVLGMAVTSVFIGIVIAGINLSARIILRAEGMPLEAECVVQPAPALQDNDRIVAAITAALLRKPKE